MDKYLIIKLLTILARQANDTVKQRFLQNRHGLYDPLNHIVAKEHNFNIRLVNEAVDSEVIPVGANDGGNVNAYLGYETVPVVAPRIREKKAINPSEIIAGISGDEKTQAKEVMQLLKNEMTSLIEKGNLFHEVLVAKALQNATLQYKVSENSVVSTKTIDLKSPAGHIVSYSAVADKKIVDVIKEGQKKIGKRYKADTLYLGSNQVAKFYTEVKDKLNQRYIEGISQKLDGMEIGGYIYHGRYDGMDVFEYSAEYVVDGTGKPLIDPNNVIVTSTQMKWKKYHGAIQDSDAIKENAHIGKIFSKSWEDKDPSATWLLTETDSISVPEDASGVYCATMPSA